ncbi:hypothetical protein D3C87_1926150 [compost metagenome]
MIGTPYLPAHRAMSASAYRPLAAHRTVVGALPTRSITSMTSIGLKAMVAPAAWASAGRRVKARYE